ncbi:MAG: tRNA (adenosine(37)-N6)-dimethylallyltransferase MiaA [Lachnospiraceae bacterium]|nr:tRNA (adenosine(37)-N6)-dimethylallyltransferase MiaA [Lachnospiraceae bacterium]
MNKKNLVVLTGPTAVGKTDLSVKLAQKFNMEIVSADSIQVYKYMDIGSAKVRPEEMKGIKHYLVDELDPKVDFNVAVFKEMAYKAFDEIYAKGKIPLIVGGTGFYIQALLKDVNFEEEDGDTEYRAYLEQLAKDNGAHYLNCMLAEVDKVSAEKIHENNIKRTIRALEFFKIHGYPISAHNEKEMNSESPFNYAYFVLNDLRELLYKRINMRVDIMEKEGLIDEVKHLREMGYDRSLVSMQGIGYKEVCAYIDGEMTLDKTLELIKKESRHFAKRQLTWFRREKDVIWVNKNEFDYSDDKILEYIGTKMQEKGIIAC